jgi:hypothetical protein
MSNYIVKTAAAAMPNNCWGTYRRVAVLEVQDGVADVAMISARARGVVRVHATWERLNVGHTSRCAYRRALAEAQQMAADLNLSAHASDAAAARV